MNKYTRRVLWKIVHRKVHTLEFLRKEPNQVHPEKVVITLSNGKILERDVGFSKDPVRRTESAQKLREQYGARTVKVTGQKGEDWGTYE